VEEEEECGNLINANDTEDFGAENDGTRFKRTITTKQFLIPVRNGEMTRTIKRTRITYLTKTNLAEDFLTQLENLNYELPRQSSFYIVYFYIHTTTYSFLAHIKQFFMRLILMPIYDTLSV